MSISTFRPFFTRNEQSYFPKSVIDSCKRDKNLDQPPRRLYRRHLFMLAIGTSIRTSFFVGSGKALAAGGPGTLLITGLLTGIMIYSGLTALCEMTIVDAATVSFTVYSSRFIDPAWGFALGWNYTIQGLTTLILEIIAASAIIKVWTDSVGSAILIGACLIILFIVMLLTSERYINIIAFQAVIKVLAIIGCSFGGLVIILGGGPKHQFIGGRNWANPGSFNNGFLGFSSVLIFSVFSLSGLEILSLAAVETINPVKAFPSSVRTTFWVTLPLSITSIIAVGFLVPFTDIRLLRVPAHYDVNASPFVIAFNDAGVTGLGNLLNVVVLVTTFSTAMSSIYVSSRNFVALAKQNHAPRIFAYIDQKGRPTIGLLLSLCTGFFAFTGSARGADIAFAWLISVSGISSIFVWGSICLSHIRFRRGWEKQGHALTELPYRSPFGKLGSWYGLSFNVAVLLSQLWTCTGPNTYTDSASIELIGSFLAAYIYAPIILVLYTGYKIWHRTSLVRSNSMFFRSSINGSAEGTQAGTVMLDSLPS